jgi:hypothetical protein
MDTQTITFVCDGSLQTLADFHGVATYCMVRNGLRGEPISVYIRGLKETALAPGNAIACRSSLVKVTGPKGQLVTVEFSGSPDLALGA